MSDVGYFLVVRDDTYAPCLIAILQFTGLYPGIPAEERAIFVETQKNVHAIGHNKDFILWHKRRDN